MPFVPQSAAGIESYDTSNHLGCGLNPVGVGGAANGKQLIMHVSMFVKREDGIFITLACVNSPPPAAFKSRQFAKRSRNTKEKLLLREIEALPARWKSSLPMTIAQAVRT